MSLKLFPALLLSLLLWTHAHAQDALPEITVYKSPTCGCCTAWVEYMEDNGFRVKSNNVDNLDAMKAELGLTDQRLRSCHTAVVDGYVVEGHVPVDDVKRLLAERPDIKGISAPGMPQFSPGMASLTPKDYDVIAFDAEGNLSLYSRY